MAARNNRKFLSTSALTLGLIALGAGSALAMDDFTTPTGEQVVGGSATFDRPAAGQLNINQNTDRVVINWDSFNIGSKGKTEFFQPNSGSLAVNRVTSAGTDPTQILGTLKANGKVMVLDRNGVFFGHDAVLDVGTIVASTGDIDTSAVMRGDTVLELSSFGDGSIINNGMISVGNAGLAAFVAPHVANNGIIQARLGKVVLASGGERATVDLYGDGLVQIAVDGAKTRALSENNGAIDAEGGTVLMTAQAAKGVVDNVINMNGVIKVSSVTQKGGKIILSGGSSGKVSVKGTLDASGENGGQIDVRGQDIDVGQTALLLADGGQNGDGGTNIVFADNLAIINGRLTARGGLLGGNGGFIETSGLELGISELASVDASAMNGNAGLWLIDPLSIIIAAGSGSTIIGADGKTYAKFNSTVLSSSLSGTNVIIETGVNSGNTSGSGNQNEGDIIVQDAITKTGSTATKLTLRAHDDIIINNTITATDGALSVDLLAGYTDGSGTNNDNDVIVSSAITTNGGNFLAQADRNIAINAAISTGAGSATLTATDGDIILGGNGGNGDNGLNGGNGSAGDDAFSGKAAYWDSANTSDTFSSNPGAVKFKDNPGNDDQWYYENFPNKKYSFNPGNAILVQAVLASNGANGSNGTTGTAGANGSNGGNGTITTTSGDIVLNANSITLGGQGGKGGNGGSGGVGGTGGDGVKVGATKYSGGNGGMGGDGGQGGQGGTGGNGGLISTNGNITLVADNIGFAGQGGAPGDSAGTDRSGIKAADGNPNGGIKGIGGNGGDNGGKGLGGAGGSGSITTGSTVTIARKSIGNVSVGDNNGGLVLDQSKLNKITAAALVIGRQGTSSGDDTIYFDNADLTRFNLVTANTRTNSSDSNTSSRSQDVVFDGLNQFKGLIVNAEDGIIVNNNVRVSVTAASTFNAGLAGSVGDFLMLANSAVDGNGANLTINAKNVSLNNNADIDSEGGNILIGNTGKFSSTDSNSLHTSGAGTITLNQSDDGNIQNAIDAIDNTGSGLNTINVGAGTYNENVRIYENNFALLGAKAGVSGNDVSRSLSGAGESKIVDGSGSDGTAYGFKVTSSNVRIDGFSVNVDGAGVLLDGGVSGKSGFLIENNVIKTVNENDSLDVGIQGKKASNVTIEDNNLVTIGNDGMDFNGGSNVTIRNNTVNATDGGSYDGIRLTGVDTASVTGNTVHNTGDDGIVVEDGTGTTTVSGNTVYNVDKGINVNNTEGLNVSGNTVYNADENAIHVVSSASAQIANNFVGTLGGVNNIKGDGIYVEDSNGATIKGNTVTETYSTAFDAGSGIHIKNSNGVIVGGVGTDRNTLSNIDWDGVKITGGDNVTVDNNRIENVTRVGIYGGNTTNATIKNNVLVNANTGLPGYGAISTDGGSNLTVSGNDIDGSIGHGIRVNGATGTNLIDGNFVDGVSQDGVRAESVSGLTVSGNQIGQTGTVGGNGVSVIDSASAYIYNNLVGNFSGTGIFVDPSPSTIATGNTINGGLIGIHVLDSDDVTVGGFGEGEENTITGSGTGILVDNSDNADVLHNRLYGTGTGVHVLNSAYADVLGNTVQGYGYGTGILVENGDNARIGDGWSSEDSDRNTISSVNTGIAVRGVWYGDYIDSSDYVTIDNNEVYSVNNGIDATDTYGLNIEDNDLSGGHCGWGNGAGIYVGNSENVRIGGRRDGNDIDSFWNGITVSDSDNVRIRHNDVWNIGNDGIQVFGGNHVLISRNDVWDAGNDGIYVGDMFAWSYDEESEELTPNVIIRKNNIDWTGNNGIAVSNVYSSLIDGNNVGLDGEYSIGAAGIYVTNENYDDPTTITGNLVANTDDEGIYVDGVAEVTISGNTVWNTNYDGIAVYDAWDNVLISDNYVGAARGEIGGGFIDGDGIYVSDSGSIWITDNVVAETSDDGIEVRNIDFAEIDMNRVLNSSANGFHAGGIYNGTVILAGNTFTDNAIGALFESGLIDLTGEANTFNGGDIGMRFDPAALYEGYFLRMNMGGDDGLDIPRAFLALKEDTIGTTMFNGQSQYYVELLDGALFNPGTPTIINGLDATYDGFRPSSVGGVLTQAQYDALESKIFHYNDQSTLGLFFFGLVPSQINQEDIYNRFAGFTPGSNGFRMTILGLPGVGGRGGSNGGNGGNGGAGNLAGFLANIAPAAGGDGGEGNSNSLGGEMENMEPAAGGSEETSCWADAMNSAFSGKTVSYSFGSSPEEALADTAACSASAS